MGRKCTVCTHPDVAEIDKLLLGDSASYRKIAKRFGLSEGAVGRHARNHLPEIVGKAEEMARVEVAKRHEVKDLEHALDVIEQLKEINTAARVVLHKAMQAQDGDLALKAVDRVHRQIELQAKLIGELDEGPSVNVTLAPQWVEIRTVLMDALAPHPEARAAVARALLAMEGNGRGA